MRHLLDILLNYEHAVQATTEEHSNAVLQKLQTARQELSEVLRVSRSCYTLLQAAEMGLQFASGGWESPSRTATIKTLQTAIQQMKGALNGTVVNEGKGTIDRGTEPAAGRLYGGGCF